MTKAEREELLNSAFMAEWLDGYCFGEEDEEDQFNLIIVYGLGHRFVAVVNEGCFVDRLWINSDGTVWVASGSDDPFLPQLDFHSHTDMSRGGKWYCGDEIEQVGKDFKFEYGLHWHASMCIPEVKTLGISKASYAYLTTKWFLEYPEKRV